MNSPKKAKVLIFIVAYNAEASIEKVLDRIPRELFEDEVWESEVLVIDDASPDETFQVGHQATAAADHITFLKNPRNLGYGGNQKLGYAYAIERGFDFVALVHGDGQYAPEELPKLLQPLVEGRAEAVFGSRMLKPGDALKGGMPLYKFVGNKVLTTLQNAMLAGTLSEWHSGYRLYSVKALSEVPFAYNSNDFDFDTDIIIQMLAAKNRIVELAIPTFYGDEICHVNGLQYGAKILFSCMLFRLQQLGIFYQSKFDLHIENQHYESKFDFASSHQFAHEEVDAQDAVLNLGAGPLELVEPYLEKGCSMTVVDAFISESMQERSERSYAADLNTFDFATLDEAQGEKRFSKILALDIIEHLSSPEALLQKIRASSSCQGAQLVLSTPNVAFAPLRFMFLLGFFNYGKRGILDKTHTRLFTLRSLKKMLQDQGFEVLEVKGVPAPFPLAVGRNRLAALLLALNRLLIRLSPGLFSYQLFVRARALPTVKQLLADAEAFTAAEVQRIANTGADYTAAREPGIE